jgi:hypothetical protein
MQLITLIAQKVEVNTQFGKRFETIFTTKNGHFKAKISSNYKQPRRDKKIQRINNCNYLLEWKEPILLLSFRQKFNRFFWHDNNKIIGDVSEIKKDFNGCSFFNVTASNESDFNALLKSAKNFKIKTTTKNLKNKYSFIAHE